MSLRKRLKRLRARIADGVDELDRRLRPTRDVAVISYPKSGRTWLRFMLNEAGVKLLFEHAGAENRDASLLEEISNKPLEWCEWRVIFLHRDPRDTVVSSYFEATKRLKPSQRFHGTISEFMRDPRYGLAKIAGFNLLWLKCGGLLRDFTAASYEDLHRDTPGEISRLIHFATGEAASGKRVSRAVQAGAFENMRSVERSLGGKMDERLKLGGGCLDDPESLKTRKGKVGGWCDYFGSDDAAHMNSVLDELNYWESIAELSPSRC